MWNVVRERSLKFWIRISKFYVYLKKKNLFEISSQIFRSWTSIGANIAEAQYAISRREFVSKLQISLKEAFETIYWFEVLENWFWECCKSLKDDCIELTKLLISIIKSSKYNIHHS